jgi:hypothetical protein
MVARGSPARQELLGDITRHVCRFIGAGAMEQRNVNDVGKCNTGHSEYKSRKTKCVQQSKTKDTTAIQQKRAIKPRTPNQTRNLKNEVMIKSKC